MDGPESRTANERRVAEKSLIGLRKSELVR
jgi:hypothetical protein